MIIAKFKINLKGIISPLPPNTTDTPKMYVHRIEASKSWGLI